MKYLLLVFICFLLCVSCLRSNEKVIAFVYDETLTYADLEELIPDFNTQSDSVVIPPYYIDAWVQKQVLLHEAKKTLSREEKNFDKELEAYRESLLIFAYENKKVETLLNKEVSDNEIRQYYEQHKLDFEMRKNIVKVNYIKLSLNFKQLALARHLMFAQQLSLQDKKKLENIANNDAENMYFENDWLLFDDILKEIPINTYKQEQYLHNNRNIELSDSNSVYLVKIIDFKINEAYSPLSIEKENIKNIILNQRKQVLLKKIRLEALEKAQKQRAIIVDLERQSEKE